MCKIFQEKVLDSQPLKKSSNTHDIKTNRVEIL